LRAPFAATHPFPRQIGKNSPEVGDGGNRAVATPFYIRHFTGGDFAMNRRDQELLEKQLHGLTPAPRNDGILMLAVLAIFFVGIALGGFLYAVTSEPGPIQIASNDVPVMALPHTALHIRLQ
jgi:hypothetical protein